MGLLLKIICQGMEWTLRPTRSFLGAPLQAGGSLLRREYALVYRARLLNKTGPVEVMLWDKLYDFAHLLSNAGNSEEIFRRSSSASATGGFRSYALEDLRRSQVVFSGRLGPCEKPASLGGRKGGKVPF